MDKAKHDLLTGTLAYPDRTHLLSVAAAGGVTLHALVTALLGRATSQEASTAAANVPVDLREAVRVLATSWPWTCSFCHRDFPRLTGRCAHCQAVGCIECVPGAGCPACREKIAARDAHQVARALPAPTDTRS